MLNVSRVLLVHPLLILWWNELFLFNFKQLNTIILLILIYSIQLPIDYNYLE